MGRALKHFSRQCNLASSHAHLVASPPVLRDIDLIGGSISAVAANKANASSQTFIQKVMGPKPIALSI